MLAESLVYMYMYSMWLKVCCVLCVLLRPCNAVCFPESVCVCVPYVLKSSLFSIYLHTCMYLCVSISVSITNALSLPPPPPPPPTGVREVVVCKDAKGKVGVSLFAESKGIFVSYVKSGSPASMAGLRFGDQILQVSV